MVKILNTLKTLKKNVILILELFSKSTWKQGRKNISTNSLNFEHMFSHEVLAMKYHESLNMGNYTKDSSERLWNSYEQKKR